MFTSTKPTEKNKFDVVELDARDPGLITYLELQNRKYDIMYAKRAYMHWIFGSGISADSLGAAREDVAAYLRDMMLDEGGEDMAEEPEE